MAEAEVIKAVGRNNKPINVGDVVKYVNTDTISRVIEIKEDEYGVWALLEATNLWYRDETLEPTDIELKEKVEKREFTSEEMEERLRRGKDDMAAFDLSKTTGGGAGG